MTKEIIDGSEDIIPYIAVKFSNNDLILCELITETPTVLFVRNAICLRKVFVSDANGVKKQKKIASMYCELARNGELIVPKYTCNYIAVLRDIDRPYYELLVDFHINKISREDVDSPAEKEDEQTKENDKPILH